VEYDVSGGNSSQGSVANEVLADYNSNIKPYTSSSAYIHEGGKPVVMAFGIAYTDFALTASDAENLINQMKSAGAYFGIGTPTNWASLISSNSAWAAVLKAANLISPWTVGAYSNSGYPGYHSGTQTSDAQYVKSLWYWHISMLTTLVPGFAVLLESTTRL
jgi:hypothetical protein